MSPNTVTAIIVALIGAAGTIVAAWIQRSSERDPTPTRERATVPRLWKYLFIALFLVSTGDLVYRWLSVPRMSKPAEISITNWPETGTPWAGSPRNIEGIVSGRVPTDAWVLVYACINGTCYIQPVDTDYHTYIEGTRWRTSTHYGQRYVALLVNKDFSDPPPVTANPPGGDRVLAASEVPLIQ